MKNVDVKEKKRLSLPKKIILTIVIILLVIALGAGIAFLVIRGMGESELRKGSNGSSVAEEYETVLYNGKEYRYNDKLINILVMGVDNSKKISYIREHVNDEKYQSMTYGGQADTLFLVTIDTENKKISLMSVNRLCMTTIQAYDDYDEVYKPEEGQICLQHACGTGLEDSCELQVEAVSNLLYNIPINSYFAMNLPGIKKLNNVAGRVKVKILEDIPGKSTGGKTDFKIGDSLMGKVGKSVKLNDRQAYAYVRYRDTNSEDSNEKRTARQKQYLKALIDKMKSLTKQNPLYPLKVRDALSDYMVTDLDMPKLMYILTNVLDYKIDINNIETIPGKQYVESLINTLAFDVDEDALQKKIMEKFYRPIE